MILFPFWVKPLAIAVVVAGFGAWCWTGGKASERKIWKAKEYDQLQAQLTQSESNRLAGRALQLEVDKQNVTRSAVRVKNEGTAGGLGLDLDRLRDTLPNIASGSPDDSLASCRERAQGLGVLLEKALRGSQECAAAAEAASDDVRALLGGWPVTEEKP